MAHGLWLTTLQRGAGVNALSRKHAGAHSASINLSYRITLELLITDKQITLINVGDHEAVY
jgi:hypothetical protein